MGISDEPSSFPVQPDTSVWHKKRYSFSVIFLVVSAIMLPMAVRGMADGYDLFQHIRFAAAYHDAILNGHFFPGWAADDNFGFGSIGIRYYPPLANYILALTNMLVGNWYDSFWITSFAWMFLSGIGVYFWVREWSRGWSATFAAVLYILVPYHTFEIYHWMLYAEFASAAILPFCFLFLTKICRRPRWADAILLSISFSLLILTHIPSAMIGSMGMGVYALLIMDRGRIKKTLIVGGTAVILSLFSTSFHWLKVVTEVNWVMHSLPQYFASGEYDYTKYFFPMFVFNSTLGYWLKFLLQLDVIVVITALFFVPSATILILQRISKAKKTPERRIDLALLSTGFFSLFMLSVASAFIWKLFPLLQKIQFPWRWLMIASLFASVSLARFPFAIIFDGKKFNRWAAYPIGSFLVVVIIFDIALNIVPSNPLPREIFGRQVENMKDEAGCECWWPIWAREEAFVNKDRVIADSRNVVIDTWDSESRYFTVNDGAATSVRIATFFHPYWKSTVNGAAVTVRQDTNGVLQLPLPANAVNIHLYFEEPTFLAFAKIVSLTTWTLYLVAVLMYLRRKKHGSILAEGDVQEISIWN